MWSALSKRKDPFPPSYLYLPLHLLKFLGILLEPERKLSLLSSL